MEIVKLHAIYCLSIVELKNKRGGGPPSIFFMYHVQFFGQEAERAWLSEKTQTLPYEGVAAFHTLCQEKIAKNKKERPKWSVIPARKKVLNISY